MEQTERETTEPTRPEEVSQPTKRPSKKKLPPTGRTKAPARKRYLLAAGVVVLSLASGFLGGWLENNRLSLQTSASDTANRQVVSSESQLISSINKTVSPSVVSVNVTSQQSPTATNFYDAYGGGGSSGEQESAGTGIIISSDGTIVTNRHVVPAGTSSVSVTLSDGTKLSSVEVIGRTSQSDTLDVAFLKIKDLKGKKLTPAKIGTSQDMKVGDKVIAIGNALGQFQNTVTSGILSGYGRSVQAGEQGGSSDDTENLQNLFKTDAAINAGNSGGPQVNVNGEVIGINTAVAGNAQGIGFAIPIDDVSGLIKNVLATGKFEQPYLGVRYVPLTNDSSAQLNVSVTRGAYIVPSTGGTPSVIADGPADKAGLRERDIIQAVNGTNIDEQHSLTSLLAQHKPGDSVTLKIQREGKGQDIKVTLGTAPQTQATS